MLDPTAPPLLLVLPVGPVFAPASLLSILVAVELFLENLVDSCYNEAGSQLVKV